MPVGWKVGALVCAAGLAAAGVASEARGGAIEVGRGDGEDFALRATVADPGPLNSRAKPARPRWAHPLVVDHGIRADRAGRGHFGASRFHGRHNGIDLLAPIGTDLRAVCAGHATGGRRSSFGNYVHLVCELELDAEGEEVVFASIFYAHLQQTSVPHGKWGPVSRGAAVGAVGKTGNAKSETVMPHVHLELIFHGTEEAARAERHSGKNQSETRATKAVLASLTSTCMQETELRSKGPWRRARRLDPFLLLSCLSADKPELTKPAAPLDEAWRKWSSHYHASTYDVDDKRD